MESFGNWSGTDSCVFYSKSRKRLICSIHQLWSSAAADSPVWSAVFQHGGLGSSTAVWAECQSATFCSSTEFEDDLRISNTAEYAYVYSTTVTESFVILPVQFPSYDCAPFRTNYLYKTCNTHARNDIKDLIKNLNSRELRTQRVGSHQNELVC